MYLFVPVRLMIASRVKKPQGVYMTEYLSPALQELKRQFIVPNEAIIDFVKPRRRSSIFDFYYCPYAPCCSDCRGIFTFREVLGHLRRIHQHGSERIKKLVAKGLPRVPEKRI